MTDLVAVRNLVLVARHGVLPEETRLGQKFHLDIVCRLDAGPAAESDDPALTVDYDKLCTIAAKMSEAGPYYLIETLADRIAASVMDGFAIVEEVTVTVRKPSAPIHAVLDHAEVRRSLRRRHELALALHGRPDAIAEAVRRLDLAEGLAIARVSSDHPGTDGAADVAVTGTAALTPQALARLCQDIADRVGTLRILPLWLGDLTVERPGLALPLPGLLQRLDLLAPLAEIAPEARLDGLRIADALAHLRIAGAATRRQPG